VLEGRFCIFRGHRS